LDDLHVALL